MQDGAEYIKANDLVYTREDFMPELQPDTVYCAIGEDGYAKYFTVGANSAGKNMTVSIPQGAAFAVYDETTAVPISPRSPIIARLLFRITALTTEKYTYTNVYDKTRLRFADGYIPVTVIELSE